MSTEDNCLKTLNDLCKEALPHCVDYTVRLDSRIVDYITLEVNYKSSSATIRERVVHISPVVLRGMVHRAMSIIIGERLSKHG
jgi:hypothetical protein